MHLNTEEPAASRMLEPFGEVGRDVPEYFSSLTHFVKIKDKKILRKIRSKKLNSWSFFFSFPGLNLLKPSLNLTLSTCSIGKWNNPASFFKGTGTLERKFM